MHTPARELRKQACPEFRQGYPFTWYLPSFAAADELAGRLTSSNVTGPDALISRILALSGELANELQNSQVSGLNS